MIQVSSMWFMERLLLFINFFIDFQTIKGADHFYENHKLEFNTAVDDYIKKRLIKA